MAACRADPEVAERRLTSATAAGLSRSSSETREIIQSWASHNHRVDHTSQPHSRSRICDCDRSLKNLGDNNAVMNYYVQSNRRETEQEEDLFSDNETHVCTDKSCNVKKNVSDDSNIGDGVADDYKMILYDEDNKGFNESGDKCKADPTAVSNGEVERDETTVSDNCNRASKTIPDDESCDDEQKMHIIREMRVTTAATDNRANGTFKSSCPSQDINKIIHSSKCERTTNIESRRDSADENKAGPMEINSTRGSGAYPHEDDIVVSVTIPRASSLRDFRNEATICKAVLSPRNKDGVRTTEETRRSATAMRNAIESFVELPNRKSRDEMDAVSFDERKARKCANCEEPRFSYYGQYSHLWKYSGYLNHDTPAAVYEARDATKIVGDRESNSRLVAAPIAAAMLFRSRSLPRLSDSGFACSDHAPVTLGQAHTASRHLVTDIRQLLTLKQHYYPEGGWGWVIFLVGMLVQILSHGAHGAVGVFLQQIAVKFGSVPNYGMKNVNLQTGWLGAMSMSIALLISPITIAFCRRKSTRVTAVLGGLVTALGCLFTSFATQFHQLFFSYGTVVGIGIGMTRDCSTLMVAQYFKRKRELVEIFIISGSGLGIAIMSAFIKGAISTIGWRLGLQAITGVISLTFILGTFYRSASLYHPQRRAILHLKNQKRKIKDKSKIDDRTPFFDFNTLKSKTVRILLVSTGISAFGINTPIFYLAHQAEEEGLGEMVVLLQTYLGLAWIFGCVTFGFLVVHRSIECRIARQYLMQAAVFICGLCILAFTAVQENYHGYVMFAWIYGIFYGGYHYSLKMYTYEKVRARNFARTWGFVQCSQAIPIAIGVPISGYINISYGSKAGYYFSSTCVLIGSFTLFFIDLHKRNLFGYCTGVNRTKHFCTSDSCSKRRRMSFSQELENEGPHAAAAKTAGAKATLVVGTDVTQGEAIEILGTDKPELTCISEEGIADMDLPDNLFDDLDCVGDCITSCNKVEKYLMLSEFENNLIAEMPIIMDRRGRRWSLARSKTGQSSSYCGQSTSSAQSTNEENMKSQCRSTNVSSNANTRMITVIDETSA